MLSYSKYLLIIIAILLFIISISSVNAHPEMPHTFYGYVSEAADGLIVTAMVNNIPTSTIISGGWYYNLDIPADDPETPGIEGGTNGDIIYLSIDGQPSETHVFEIGGFDRLYLNQTINHAPVLHSIGNKLVNAGSLLEFTISATDIDGDILIYSTGILPGGASFNPNTHIFSWTPVEGQAGSYQVHFEITDGSMTDSEDITITVHEPYELPKQAVVDNRLRESTPNTVISGYYFIDAGRIDSIGNYRSIIRFDLSEYNSTDLIEKATLSLFWFYENHNLNTEVCIYRPTAWDPDYVTWNTYANGVAWMHPGGDWYDKNNVAHGTEPFAAVTFPVYTSPDYMYHDFDVTELIQNYVSGTYDNTGFFIKANEVETSYVAFYSSDWYNADQRPRLIITHSSDSESINHAPVLNLIGDKSVTESYILEFTISAADDDGDTPTYSTGTLPRGAGFNQDTCTFSWTPDEGQAGSYQMHFEVTDGALIDAEDITITVNEPYELSKQAVIDNRLRESTPDKILDKSKYIDAGSIDSFGNFRSLIWFDLSEFNSTDQIEKATLSLFWYYENRNLDTEVCIYRPGVWDPDYVTWNTYANDIAWNNPGSDWYDKSCIAQGTEPFASVTFPVYTSPDYMYHYFDVTELVQNYINGTYDNTGFFIKANEVDNSYVAFYSSDWPKAHQQPMLTITHSQDSNLPIDTVLK